jgi:2-methylcitrate dehydratase PrpD
VTDPTIATLREKIEATADMSLRQDEARVIVTLQDGQILVQHIDHALGSAKRPLSDGDLETKFLGLAKGVLDHGQVERIIQLCWSVADLDDISEISRKSIPLNEY